MDFLENTKHGNWIHRRNEGGEKEEVNARYGARKER